MSVEATIFNDFPGLKDVFEQAGYKDMQSLIFLHHLVKCVKPKLVLELGTGRGCSTAFMALAIGEGKVVTVDDYPQEGPHNLELAKRNLESCGVWDKITLMQGNSFDAGELIKGQLDGVVAPEIIFMDASHVDVDLRREYDTIRDILPEEHIVIVDDALANDIPTFTAWMMKEMGKYSACVLLPYHLGLAVLVTNSEYLSCVSYTVEACELLGGN